MLILRKAVPADLPRMAEVEAASWPTSLAVDADTLAARLRAYPEGQWVAELDGRIVGMAASQRIRKTKLLSSPLSYDQLTDRGAFVRSHDPQGEVFQLIGVGVDPSAKGLRLGRQLVDREIEFARLSPGIERILGFTRPAGYHQYQPMAIEEYIGLHDQWGRIVDPVLAFHLEAGARLVSVHPDFRPADVASGGYGLLIEYPVRQ